MITMSRSFTDLEHQGKVRTTQEGEREGMLWGKVKDKTFLTQFGHILEIYVIEEEKLL